jgi:hypothetical protein
MVPAAMGDVDLFSDGGFEIFDMDDADFDALLFDHGAGGQNHHTTNAPVRRIASGRRGCLPWRFSLHASITRPGQLCRWPFPTMSPRPVV